ncbi:MAG TPA: CBS domain-containing protein [Chromatiaceae bacterium]|nr:CBS domain-containing protein [Chromatiaceae bacterium]
MNHVITIIIILAQARSAGMLSVARSELLHRTLSLANKNARFLMMPRNEVDFFDINLNLEDNLKRIKNSNHSRFPLCDRDLDALIGIVDVRVLLEQMQRKKEIDLKEICTTPRYYPEVIPAEVLLQEFRKHHHAMAIIVDEYGGTSGIVTSADIVTAVMGELDDDDDGDDMVHVGEGSYDVDGITPLEEVEEELHISLKTEGMRTITGWLMEKLGRMPKMGDRIKFSGYVFSVTDVLGPKVRRVRIERE